MTFTPTPDVEISKAASELVARSGDILTYTITLNVPYCPANNVVVTDALPPLLSFVAFGNTPSGVGTNYNPSNSTMTWTFGTLAVGTYSLTYQAQVAGYVPQGTVLTNIAQVSFAGLACPKKTSVNVKMAVAYTVKIGVYNSTGELVDQISVQELSQALNATLPCRTRLSRP